MFPVENSRYLLESLPFCFRYTKVDKKGETEQEYGKNDEDIASTETLRSKAKWELELFLSLYNFSDLFIFSVNCTFCVLSFLYYLYIFLYIFLLPYCFTNSSNYKYVCTMYSYQFQHTSLTAKLFINEVKHTHIPQLQWYNMFLNMGLWDFICCEIYI